MQSQDRDERDGPGSKAHVARSFRALRVEAVCDLLEELSNRDIETGYSTALSVIPSSHSKRIAFHVPID